MLDKFKEAVHDAENYYDVVLKLFRRNRLVRPAVKEEHSVCSVGHPMYFVRLLS